MSVMYDIDLTEKVANETYDKREPLILYPGHVLAMCADIRRYEKALKWYANPENYQDKSGRRIWDDAPAAPICADMGNNASIALDVDDAEGKA